jgi:hypothetical protein
MKHIKFGLPLIVALMLLIAVGISAPASATVNLPVQVGVNVPRGVAAATRVSARYVTYSAAGVVARGSTTLAIPQGAANPRLTVTGVRVPARSWTCTVYAADPTWAVTHYVIDAEGFQVCSGSGWQPQRVRVALERKGFLGIWNIKNRNGTPWSYSSTVDYILSTGCGVAGGGTGTYRTVVDGYAVGGARSATATSGSVTMACN